MVSKALLAIVAIAALGAAGYNTVTAAKLQSELDAVQGEVSSLRGKVSDLDKRTTTRVMPAS
jgi:hypothetical protein